MLQWCYVNARADATFAAQEAKASASIQSVWTLVGWMVSYGDLRSEHKRRHLAALQQRFATAQCVRRLEQQQRAMVGSLCGDSQPGAWPATTRAHVGHA